MPRAARSTRAGSGEERSKMTTKTCRHCDITFQRPDTAPIPHDRCERCHEEIEALIGPTASVTQYEPSAVVDEHPLDRLAQAGLARAADKWERVDMGARSNEALKGGLKFDADKPRMELLIQGMPRALEEVGRVLTFGAQKYAAHSWKHVEDNQNRYWAAKTRHELARAKGEQHDPEKIGRASCRERV